MSSKESESDNLERFHFFRFRLKDSFAYDPVKTRMSKSEAEAGKNQSITRPGIERYDWFILQPLLSTVTMYFLLDHKLTQSLAEWVFCFRLRRFEFY